MSGNGELCLSDRGGSSCKGEVRGEMSASGLTFIHRCEKHWQESYDKDAETRRRYPFHAPADFDPLFAGERWEDDY